MKTQEERKIVSVPTMCLHCHLIVELERTDVGDVSKDEVVWNCPQCHHQYPGKHWKIRVAKKRDKVVA